MKNCKAVIFDLGGVLLNIDYLLTVIAFNELGVENADLFYSKKIQNPIEFPDPSLISKMEEPWVTSTIIVPQNYLGNVFELCETRRGKQIEHNFIGKTAVVKYKLPLAETIIDFYDRLKSITTGYASFDYQIDGYKESKLIKLNILVNQEIVEPLSIIVHAYST